MCQTPPSNARPKTDWEINRIHIHPQCAPDKERDENVSFPIWGRFFIFLLDT